MPLTSLRSIRHSATALQLLAVLCLPAHVAAQYPYYDRGGTPGRVVAGIVVAICFAILFLIAFSLIFRRRRRGGPILPWQSVPPSTQNLNQGPYSGYPLQSQGSYYPPPPGPPPPPSEPMPPPPYPGKPPAYDTEENSGYGYPQSPHQDGTEAPHPGGFVVPGSPHSPPVAHVNDNPHSPWFRSS
ncbi:hypothetical protein C8Q70DRAFT_244560 [Cubamyces menziesii]|uniref:Uncharacterized protein n=1 Tax=Trametes cubensis TaxID=1111947 RepID=A0AAD7X5X6_9APHY|nr:hypothetical protein C8Q70DRAFT_244560 [Cubamyces menziesii]KAJ8461825.1 hypothetical protein ONZ51_g11293 [Trametes cubensis]